MTPPVFIRTAAKRDLPAIMALLVETYHATYDPIHGSQSVDETLAEWHSDETLEKRLTQPKSEFVVADDGSAILGMAYACVKADGVMLHHLYIAPNAQGRGIGNQLMQEMFFCFDGESKMKLEVDKANTSAIGFYEALGFNRIGETANCGSENSGIPAYIYAIDLH